MGCSCDWQRTRFTLDDVCARAVRHTFFNLFKEGLIYRGKRLVNWDTLSANRRQRRRGVSRAGARATSGTSAIRSIDPKPGEPTHVTIATTRPETMLGDTAVAVHPDPAAALEQAEDELQAAAGRRAGEREAGDSSRRLDDDPSGGEEMLPQLEQLRDMALDGRDAGCCR